MSDLTEALNRIMNWLEKYQPEYAASFLPGLFRQEIDRLVTPLNILIPEEIYKLYQWRNGRAIEPFSKSVGVCPSIYEYLPLQKAIEEETIGWINRPPEDGGYLDSGYKNKILLPILGYLDPEICALVIDKKKRKNYSVVLLLEGSEIVPYCSSITNMMLILAEAYETEAYYLKEEDDGSIFLRANAKKILTICEKYNAYFVD